MKSIQAFIQRKPIVLYQDNPVQQAARALKDHRIGCAVVADHHSHIVGIVTDRDLSLHVLAVGGEEAPKTIAQVMTADPAVVEEEGASLEQVLALMESRGVRRVPVVRRLAGDLQRCEGIVTLDDLIAARAVSVERLSRIVRAQLARKLLPSKLPRDVRVERERYLENLAGKLSPKLEFNRSELEQLNALVLGTLARRLHHTGALKLIAALPAFVQPTLLALPPGPDDSATLAALIAEVCRLFEVDDPTAYSALSRMGIALEEWCEERALEHAKAQLPPDLRGIFGTAREAFQREKGLQKRAS